MNRFILSLVLSLFCITLFSQDADFSGTWIGTIQDNEGEDITYLAVEIDGTEVTQYYYDSDEELYKEYTFDVQEFFVHRNNALYFWMNQGGVWSETQSYHLSMINPNKIKMLWTRQVNNIEENGDNESWEVKGTGFLERPGGESVYNEPFVQAQSSDFFTIKKIEKTDEHTLVTLVWANESDSNTSGTFHAPGTESAMYITPQDRSARYELQRIEGITPGELTTLEPGDSYEVNLYFEPIDDITVFDIIEPGEVGYTWNFYGVLLK